MKDLRILQQQQVESQQKLQAAREQKEKRLQAHQEFEQKLEELKYENGQHRAQLQRHHEMLSRAQRLLAAARSRADRGGDKLRNFDRYVK